MPGKAPRDAHPPADTAPSLSPLGRFILDKLDRGVVLLDADGVILDASSVAQKTLVSCPSLTVRKARLSFNDPDFAARFEHLLGHRPRPGTNGRSIAGRLRCGCPRVCRVVVASADPRVMNGVRYVVLLYAQESRGVSADVLTELYGLTRAQSDVARKLYDGCTVEETAAQLRLSLNTVRSHLKQIFSRCEVQSQAELQHLLATGPQVL